MHSNIKETIKILLHKQLVTLTAKLLYKSIKSKGHIDDHTAKILAGSLPSIHGMHTEFRDQITVSKSLERWKPTPEIIQPPKKFASEEDDCKIVAQSLQKFKPNNFHVKDNRMTHEKKFSSEEEDAQLVAASLQSFSSISGKPFGCTQHSTFGKVCKCEEPNELSDKDQMHEFTCRASSLSNDKTTNGNVKMEASGGIIHVATIRSIHGDGSIRDALYSMALASAKVEESHRVVKMLVKDYSAIFSVSAKRQSESGDCPDVSSNEASMSKTVTVPISMECKAIIQFGVNDFEINFKAPGMITGMSFIFDCCNVMHMAVPSQFMSYN